MINFNIKWKQKLFKIWELISINNNVKIYQLKANTKDLFLP